MSNTVMQICMYTTKSSIVLINVGSLKFASTILQRGVHTCNLHRTDIVSWGSKKPALYCKTEHVIVHYT